ncbi:DUF502 domain-containing protein [Nitrospina watsonii]|uniref:DUF502 domain-containing protein n=1 Tax=Nitrospina watsonii TaxID=1323948 RepID=A0ABM9HBG8_9BACT|nr:DUF502 domain-containing protein [Nitrospina watsonii]CAI2717501.1 conserved protein of unknown function [Nitrospina watsonii]
MLTDFKRRLRNIFITGLLVTVPIAFTVFILNFLFKTLDNWLSPMFTKLLIFAGAPIPPDFRLPGLGVIMTLLFIFLIGVFTKNIFGAKLVQVWETIVEKIPVVRSIYTGAKQVVTTIAQTDTKAFSKVVMVEFPRRGIYSLGFVTNETRGEVQALTDEDLINVFVPTTPNPTSGFLVFVPKEDVTVLSMTVEEGLKFIISCGIVTPPYIPGKAAEAKRNLPV